MLADMQGSGGVEEVSLDLVGCGGLVAGQFAGEHPVEVPGDDGQCGVQVDVEWDAGGQGVQVKAADVGVESSNRIKGLGDAPYQPPGNRG
ncbi:hypothetical protein ABZ468_51590 [Streptomyces sp. NPDC005708]|uniref:hypothetical protein n=1 Tax=unclassified Streptomyces TaxID=2593676 RepID=UPI0033EEE574